MRLEDLLLRKRLVTTEQIAAAKERIRDGVRLDQAVVELGFVSEESVLKTIADGLGLEIVSLLDRQIPPEVLQSVPNKTVFRQQVIPIDRQNGSLRVATSNPFDLQTLDEIQSLTGLHVEPVLALSDEIATAIKSHFGVGGETVGELLSEADQFQLLDTGAYGENADELAEEASVIKLVNEILIEAIEQRTATFISSRSKKAFASATASTGCCKPRPCRPKSGGSRRRSSAELRLWRGSILPKSGCLRTAESSFACAGGKSMSASRLSR